MDFRKSVVVYHVEVSTWYAQRVCIYLIYIYIYMLIHSHIYTAKTDFHHGKTSHQRWTTATTCIYMLIYSRMYSHTHRPTCTAGTPHQRWTTARPCIYGRIYTYIYIYTQADLHRENPAFKCTTGRIGGVHNKYMPILIYLHVYIYTHRPTCTAGILHPRWTTAKTCPNWRNSCRCGARKWRRPLKTRSFPLRSST